jgi:hypothetical protein
MNHSPHPLPARQDVVAIPMIWIAALLSLVIHALVLFVVPQVDPVKTVGVGEDQGKNSLMVQLRAPSPSPAPAAKPAPPSTAQVTPPPARRGLPEKPAPRPPTPPRAVPFNRPAPVTPAPPTQPPQAAPAAPPATDLAAYIEARRRARGETEQPPAARQEPEVGAPQPQESEEERRNRIIAANLGLDRAPGFGGERSGGGVFQVTRMGYSEAEFIFFGWNKDIKRTSRQRIEVSRGDAPDIRVAMVRRMIVLIREQEKGDFTWVSHRLGREVSLSARPGDQAGLEDFLLKEFFPAGR